MQKITDIIKRFTFILLRYAQIIFQFLFGVDSQKAFFSSFSGRQYSDNPRAISEKLFDAEPSFKIYWSFENPKKHKDVIPSYVKSVKKFSLLYFYTLATSKFWIDNNRKNNYIYKSSKQIYILTWHGDKGFKKIGYDVGTEYSREKGNIIEDRICDYILTGSSYAESVYRSAFSYNGKFLKVGSPRNDNLIHNDELKLQLMREKLQVHSKRILMYAPTFRNDNMRKYSKQSIQDLDFTQILDILEMSTNQQWICLLRGHYFVQGLQHSYNDPRISDYSDYTDMADLLLVTDLLITDYSTCAGDFILTDKPVILYQPDRTIYDTEERGLYFDVFSSGFMITESQEEVNKALLNLHEIAQRNEGIRRFYGDYESGRAAELTVKKILSLR